MILLAEQLHGNGGRELEHYVCTFLIVYSVFYSFLVLAVQPIQTVTLVQNRWRVASFSYLPAVVANVTYVTRLHRQ